MDDLERGRLRFELEQLRVESERQLRVARDPDVNDDLREQARINVEMNRKRVREIVDRLEGR